MRIAAALTAILLVLLMRAAAVPDVHIHRKVLQDTKRTRANAFNETKAVDANGVNATQASTPSSNATANATDHNRARGDGWGQLGRGPVVCYESISCRKRMLMQAAAATNETKTASADFTNVTAVAVNAAGSSAVNASLALNATGNATDARNRRGFNNGGGHGRYRGADSYDTFSQADQVHCELTGCKKRRLLAESAAYEPLVGLSELQAIALRD